jgi:hypothetical protein
LGTEGHRDLLTVNNESFLLQVWLKDTLSASQRKAHVVTELLTFTGEIAFCCHNSRLLLVICTSLRYFSQSVNDLTGIKSVIMK